MESVSRAELQRFRDAKYLERVWHTRLFSFDNIRESGEDSPSFDLTPFLLSEESSLHLLGRDIGFFEDQEPDDSYHEFEGGDDALNLQLRYPGIRPAFDPPVSFLPSHSELRFDEKSVIGMFQTALSFTAKFNDPRILFLREALEDERWLLRRNAEQLNQEEIWLSLVSEYDEETERPQEAIATCLAGFIRLIDVLDDFRRVYPLDLELSRLGTEEGVGSMPRYLAETFKWRLNLHRSATTAGIDFLSDAFLELCRKVFETNSEAIFWDEKRSAYNLRRLFQDWKSRTADDRYPNRLLFGV